MEMLTYLGESPNPKEALKWLYKASLAGHTRAQYQLALCLHQGRGIDPNMQEAVCNSFPCSHFSSFVTNSHFACEIGVALRIYKYEM